MDCDTFERIVLDRVFLELDELTMGAAQRHVAHCSRCRSIEVGLRATRDVCRLPLVAPMEGFAEGVVAFERQIHAILPFRQRANRAISVLAAYAMRPQPTMAALLLLMIGASLFLVRTRPAERDLVQIAERGVPEAELEQSENMNANFANSYATAISAPVEAPDSSSRLPAVAQSIEGSSRDSECPARCKLDGNCGEDGGTSGCRAPNKAEYGAQQRDIFGNSPISPAQQDPHLAASNLETASSARKASGCSAKIQPFEEKRMSYPSSEAGQAATWDAAECYFEMNRKREAQALFELLARSPKYAKRAKSKLRALRAQ
jgi:hypothetical protein